MYKLVNLFHNKTVRSGSIFAIFSFLNKGLSFPIALILSAYILPDSYGKLSMYNTVNSFLSIVITLNTFGIVAVKYFQVGSDDRSRYLNIVLCNTIVVLFFFLIIFVIFNDLIFEYIGLSFKILLLCLFFCFFNTLYQFLLEFYRLEERASTYGWITVAYTLFNIGLSLYLVIILKKDWYGRVASEVLITLIFGLYAIFLLRQKGYLRTLLPNKKQYIETLRWGVPLIPHDISGWLKQGVDRIIINFYFPSSSVGLFSYAFNFANIITMMAIAFNNSNAVNIYKCLSIDPEGSKMKLRKLTLMMLGFFLILTIVVDLFSYILVPILFSNYTGSLIYLIPLSLSSFFISVYALFCNYLFYYGKTKQLMKISITVALIHLSLSLLLTHYSVLLTAYISALSSFLQALFVYLYSRKIYKII